MSGWATQLASDQRAKPGNLGEESRASDIHEGGARGLIAAGIIVLVVFFGLIGSWAALSPLDSAVVANGAFEALGNRKALQHREGGIVKSVLAHDGDVVSAGRVLMLLDDTASRSLVTSLSVQSNSLTILRARLTAERDNVSNFPEPPGLAELPDAETISRLILSQQNLMTERRRQMDGQIAIFERVTGQQQDQSRGLAAQVQALDLQLTSLRDETEATRKLYASGFATRTRVSAFERTLASLEGERGRLTAQIASLEGAVAETGLRQVQLRRDRLSEIADQLRQTEQQLEELGPRLVAARDTFDRTVMRAPATGTVYGLNVFTVGGVIAAGQKVLEIVPDEGQPDLVVRIATSDAERIRVGQNVDITLPGVAIARRPLVSAHVAAISADKLNDIKTGASYYEARVKLDSIKRGPGTDFSAGDVRISPGMPGEAVIGTGSRTVLHYLLGPLSDQIRRAMREE